MTTRRIAEMATGARRSAPVSRVGQRGAQAEERRSQAHERRPATGRHGRWPWVLETLVGSCWLMRLLPPSNRKPRRATSRIAGRSRTCNSWFRSRTMRRRHLHERSHLSSCVCVLGGDAQVVHSPDGVRDVRGPATPRGSTQTPQNANRPNAGYERRTWRRRRPAIRSSRMRRRCRPASSRRTRASRSRKASGRRKWRPCRLAPGSARSSWASGSTCWSRSCETQRRPTPS